MSRAGKIKAVLLDFYGTVVEEDDAAIGQICREVADAATGPATPEEVGAYWGRVFGALCRDSTGRSFRLQRELEMLSLRRVLSRFGADLDATELSGRLWEYWIGPAPLPGSREAIAQCPLPVCLVSNIDNADLASALKHVRMSFDHVVTSEDSRAYKPRPEPFRRALGLLGLQPHEVLHVGDSVSSDVASAKAMGMPVLWINPKGRPAPTGPAAPDYTAASLAGLVELMGDEVAGV